MSVLQNYDLNLSMSPVLLKTFFAGASSPVAGDKCVLDRIQLIWREDREPEVITTPILVFPRYTIAKADLANEMELAINGDLESLNFQYDLDDEVLSRPANDHLSSQELNITNPYITEDIDAVDTLYRLTMSTGEKHDLFVMRYYLLEHMSEQVEISVRKALRGLDKAKPSIPMLFQPKVRSCL